ncbi:MAG: TonB-dependent receptor, partial [Hyphomonadaceae bacterium]|nr:TonB-dependent receptor [Hyphomonadaceae bacterium]
IRGPHQGQQSKSTAHKGRRQDCTRPIRRNIEIQLATREPSRQDIGPGELTLRADATYLIDFLRAASPLANAVNVVDTVGNPVDLKARLGATYDIGRFNASAFVNYTDGFTDNLSTPSRAVDAWTTIDLHLGWRFGPSDSGRGPELSLSVVNALDEDPPFVNNAAGVGYDPSNADPLGRFVAVELRTRF